MSESLAAKFSLSGHVALVTGSTAGLGKEIALALGRANAKIVLNYAHDGNRAEQTLRHAQHAGIDAVLIRADVTDKNDVDRLFSDAEERLGGIDIVVANAAAEHHPTPFEQSAWDSYQTAIRFFIKSPFLLAKRALPHMKQKHWGRIVNITSDVVHRGTAYFSAYAAAKGGQVGWSRSLATELARDGITVNMVAPGWIPVERHWGETQETKEQYFLNIPVGRWGTPDDVASAVLYLASEEAGFITGQTLFLSGGLNS